jgi:hypothetical protein
MGTTFLGAFFGPPETGRKTGLFAPIPQPLRGFRDFRFYPWRAHGFLQTSTEKEVVPR